jgi:hypothetical protein
VYRVLPVSVVCPFLIAPSILSNIYSNITMAYFLFKAFNFYS